MAAFQSVIDKAAFEEVTRSLRVEQTEAGYNVKWEKDNKSHEEFFDKSDFCFFRRGDTDSESHSIGDSLTTTNDANSLAFAREVFGVDKPKETGASDRDKLYTRAGFVLDVAFLVGTLLIGELSHLQVAVLAPLFFLEYFRKGGLLVSIYLWVAAFTNLCGGVLIGAPVYAVLQYFDPRKELRVIRLAVSMVAVAPSLWFALYSKNVSILFGSQFWLLIILALFLSASNSFHGTHRRLFPLAFPFFCVGLALTGFDKTAWAGFICQGMRFVFVAYAPRLFARRR